MEKSDKIYWRIEDIVTTIFFPGIVLTLVSIMFFEKFILGTDIITDGLLDMELKHTRIYLIIMFSACVGLLIDSARNVFEFFIKLIIDFIKKCCKCKKKSLVNNKSSQARFCGNMGLVFVLILAMSKYLKDVVGHYFDTFSKNPYREIWDRLLQSLIIVITIVLLCGYLINLKKAKKDL